MARKNLLSIVLLTAILFSTQKAFSFEGPLQYKNQFPLFTHLGTPYLESAAPETSFSLNLSYSSIFMVRDSSAWSLGLDMEAAEADFRFKKNIRDSLEIGADIPFLSFNSGFMDDFVNHFHHAFGFPNYGREKRPLNKFLYTVKENGTAVINGEGGRIGLGDIRLTAKKTLVAGDPALSIKADIELPTGDAKKGYGNGSVDTALSLLVDNELSERLKAYGNFGFVFPGNLKAGRKVILRDYAFVGAALEWLATKNLGLIGQLYYERSPYPKTGINVLDRVAVLLAVGARYTTGNDIFEFTLTEDPSTSGAPDFSLTFAYKRKFR